MKASGNLEMHKPLIFGVSFIQFSVFFIMLSAAIVLFQFIGFLSLILALPALIIFLAGRSGIKRENFHFPVSGAESRIRMDWNFEGNGKKPVVEISNFKGAFYEIINDFNEAETDPEMLISVLNRALLNIRCGISLYAVPYSCAECMEIPESIDSSMKESLCGNKYFYRTFIFLYTSGKNPEIEIQRNEDVLRSSTEGTLIMKRVDGSEAEDIMMRIGE